MSITPARFCPQCNPYTWKHEQDLLSDTQRERWNKSVNLCEYCNNEIKLGEEIKPLQDEKAQ
jgi:hypothetical protein